MDSLSLLASAGTGSIYLWAYTAVSIASFYLFFQLILKPYLESKEPFTDIPSLPNSHWLTGSAYQILRDPDFRKVQERTFNDYADAKGRTGFWVFTQRCVVLTDAEDVRTVLEQVTNKSAPVAAKYFSRRAFGPNTLPLMNGKHWLVHRAKINRSMHPSSITSMRESSAQVVQVAATTLKALVQGHAKSTSFVMDVEILGKCITVDDWGVYALLHQFRCCENFELVRFVQCFNIMMKDVVDRMQGNLFDVTSWLYFLPVAKNIRFRYANQNVRQLMKEFIEEHRAKACKEHDTAEEKKDDEATTKCRKILLDNLMDVYDEQKYDINTFVDVMITLLFAGYDGASKIIAYALYLISTHPEVEANCLEEIRRCGRTNSENLVYMSAVYRETLRIYPTGSVGNYRTLIKPVELNDGVVLPANTFVLLPFWNVHRNKRNFARAAEFRPDRWVQKDMKTGAWVERTIHTDTVDPNSSKDFVPPADPRNFFAFSWGPRHCPGQGYARQTGVLALAGLLEQFSFTPVPGYVLKPIRVGVTQEPEGGIPMQIALRDQEHISPRPDVLIENYY